MSENHEKRGLGPAITFVALAILMLPVVYVLSVKPVFWLTNTGWISVDTYFWVLHGI